MQNRIITSISCLIIAMTAMGQTYSIHTKGLKGIIVGTDKEPLPFVNVVLLKDSTFVAGVAMEIPNKLTPMKLFKLTPVLSCVC